MTARRARFGCRWAWTLLLWGVSSLAQAQGVDFAWRSADLQRQQRAFSAPRTMFDTALAAHDAASRRSDARAQLTSLLEAATAAVWLGEADGDEVLSRIPRLRADADPQHPEQRGALVDLMAYRGLILTAAGRLDDAQAVLAQAEQWRDGLTDPGHNAMLKLAWGLLTLLRDDAEGALAHFGEAYEFAVHDLTRGLILTWQASVSRRASRFQYDLLRVSLLKARESDRLVAPERYPVLGMINLGVMAQSEALLGEQYEGLRHSREFAKLASSLDRAQGVSYAGAGMVRILSQFRRQDFVLAEQLGRRRVLLTWGLLAAALLAGSALTAIVVQSRQRRALQAASSALTERNTQLQALNTSHTRLLAASCHDLREPAHALCLLADIAAADAEQGTAAGATNRTDEHLATIRYCSMKLTDMLSELLDLTRIEAGQYVAERKPVSLQMVLDDVALNFQEHARRQGIQLDVIGTDLHVMTDPYLLRRMLFSLVGTAVRTTHAGHVRISAQHDRLGRVQLRVQDSSPGLAPEVLSAMLDRGTDLGRQHESSNALDLGVSIVKRAAELLAIPLEVTSQSGRGNLVKLTLEGAPAPDAAPSLAQATPGAAGVPLHIALLEDDHEARQGMTALLKHWEFEVIAASNAQQLASQLKSAQIARPDLLITDLHLGAANGLQEAEKVRRWPGCEQLPVLLITGDQGDDVARDAARMGAQLSYKPLLPRQLRASIQTALAGAAPSRQLAAQEVS